MVIREMSKGECLRTLSRAWLGRLACAHEDHPYVLPVYFVYHEPYLYGFTTHGQKAEWLRSNPFVCVEAEEMVDGDDWTTILVFGQYEELPDTPEWKWERLRAHDLLQRHAEWWGPGCASCPLRHSREPVSPIYYRIRIDRVSGRRAVPDPGEPLPS